MSTLGLNLGTPNFSDFHNDFNVKFPLITGNLFFTKLNLLLAPIFFYSGTAVVRTRA